MHFLTQFCSSIVFDALLQVHKNLNKTTIFPMSSMPQQLNHPAMGNS